MSQYEYNTRSEQRFSRYPGDRDKRHFKNFNTSIQELVVKLIP